MPKDKEYNHNKGQSDCSEGKHDSGRNNFVQDFFSSAQEIEDNHDNADSYDEGWSHTFNQ